jgi:hypothetical protein
MRHRTLSRRALVKKLAIGAVAGASVSRHGFSAAAATEKLSVTDPEALALGYVEDAARVDVKKFPAYVRGSNCENCLQLEGQAGNAYRPCVKFPGKLVSVGGWCTAWTAEM